MSRTKLFTLKISPEERQEFEALARREQRTVADTLRLLVRRELERPAQRPEARPANQA